MLLDLEYCEHLGKKVTPRFYFLHYLIKRQLTNKSTLILKVGVENIRRCESLNDNQIFVKVIIPLIFLNRKHISKAIAKYKLILKKTLADIVKSHLDSDIICSKQLPLRCPKCINETCGPMKHFFKSNQIV